MILKQISEDPMAEPAKKDNSTIETEKTAGGGEGKKSNSSLLWIILIAILLISNIAIFLFLTPIGQGLIGIAHGPEAAQKPVHEASKSPTKKDSANGTLADIDPATLSYVSIKDLVVNLRSPGAKKGFLKLSLELEVKDHTAKETVEKLLPRIVDQFQVFLRELDFEDLKGAAGLERVRQELLSRASHVVEPIEINNLLFVELVVTR